MIYIGRQHPPSTTLTVSLSFHHHYLKKKTRTKPPTHHSTRSSPLLHAAAVLQAVAAVVGSPTVAAVLQAIVASPAAAAVLLAVLASPADARILLVLAAAMASLPPQQSFSPSPTPCSLNAREAPGKPVHSSRLHADGRDDDTLAWDSTPCRLNAREARAFLSPPCRRPPPRHPRLGVEDADGTRPATQTAASSCFFRIGIYQLNLNLKTCRSDTFIFNTVFFSINGPAFGPVSAFDSTE